MAEQTNFQKVKYCFKQGNTAFNNGDYQKAIECYEKAIELNPDYAGAYRNMGGAYYRWNGQYEKAIECYQKSIELKPDVAEAYFLMGVAYFYWNGQYEKAIECYEKAIELEPKFTFAYCNMGVTYKYWNEQYEKAIECFEKAIELDSDLAEAYIWIGFCYDEQKQYEEAIEYYEKTIGCYKTVQEQDERYTYAYYCMGLAYANNGNEDDAIIYLKEGKLDRTLFGILRNVKKDKIAQKVAKQYLSWACDNESNDECVTFFKNVVGNNAKDPYKDVYILSLQIMALLHIGDRSNVSGYEDLIAHNTSVNAVKELLLYDSPFRLTTSNMLNDPKEGLTLLDSLGIKQLEESKQDEYSAFVGSFTFNLENLTMFRLYGKCESKEEATGVSIALDKSFFKDKVSSVMGAMLSDGEGGKEKEEKYPLFRCIYIDPATGFVESVGHKDKYILNKEGKENIETYKKGIENIEKQVQKKLGELKKAIKGLDNEVVGKLLLQLRYLIKHVAFKEEQECRIVQIEKMSDKSKVKEIEDSGKFYIDYLPINKSTQKLMFAPRVGKKEMDVFCNQLKRNNLSRIVIKHCTDLPFNP